MLRIANVSKRFGGFAALTGVSMDVPAGSLQGLIGPNGAGKSTLFSVISGFMGADSGQILFSDTDVTGLAADARARRGLSRTFQVPQEFTHLTVRENLAVAVPGQPGERLFDLYLRPGRSRQREAEVMAEVEDVLDLIRLGPVADQKAGNLSGGQRKLLELGRLLLSRPKLMLLDEPFAGVNPVLIEAIGQTIRTLNAKGVGFLIVEPHIGALARIVDHIHVMDRGRLLASGPPDEVLKNPAVQDAYLGGTAWTVLLEVEDLRGGYGDADILNGVVAQVRAEEIVAVAGPNGSGKSTMAKAVMGLLPRVRGRVRFAGEDILAHPGEERVRRGISYVPQVANVFPSLSVTENLAVVEARSGRKRPVEEMFSVFPVLAERRRQRAGSLSGGERQQLAFARALVSSPVLIILDEATANVSPDIVAEMFRRIAAMPSLGTAVLLVEQRAREALAIADRGYILNAGLVAAEGAAADLLADATLAERFLGHAHA